MPVVRSSPRRLIPLHVTLAAVFVSLFLVFGLALTLFSYAENKKMALLSGEDLTERIAAQLRSTISGLYLPAQGFIDLASKSLNPGTETLEARLVWLDPLAEALRQNPSLTSIFIGFDDGDFFQVRSLSGRQQTARHLGASEGATLAVLNLDRGTDGQVTSRLLFFDDTLSRLGEAAFDDAFDPRDRDWYQLASTTTEPVTTDFYLFLISGELGVTFARSFSRGGAVVGADLSMNDISASLRSQLVTPGTRIVVVDEKQALIALSEPEFLESFERHRPRLAELDDEVYRALSEHLRIGSDESRFQFEAEGRQWLAATNPMPARHDFGVTLVTLIPLDELLSPVDRIRNQSLLISIVLLALAIVAVLWLSHNVSSSLRALALEASEIRRFRLSTPMRVSSRIAEVDELASMMAVMKSTLEKSFAISRALATEKDPKQLLEMILREARKIANAEGGVILTANQDASALEVAILEHSGSGIHVGGSSQVDPRSPAVPLSGVEWDSASRSADLASLRAGRTLVWDDLEATADLDASALRQRFSEDGSGLRALMAVPLIDQQGGVAGLLQLVDPCSPDGAPSGFDEGVVPAIEALAADAAVALDLRRLLAAQKELLNSLIHLLAAAIDAKSPYTHGHCQRVPVIALLLARAAHDAERGPLAQFQLDDDEWDELHIAAWLHDCGKVTTPEYVVDKATRLETLHNRIHEIRTRFEVLWRDAEIDYLRAVAAGRSEIDARAGLDRMRETLQEEWAFVAESNIGETFMDSERIERLLKIGSRSWSRHFDDRIGLAHGELSLRPERPTPAIEQLLADAVHHVIPRDDPERPFGDNVHGFRMPVPANLYNHGELYNLSIKRGTLSEEERFKINEHIVATIEMLSRLPFPRELSRVPEWAGNHHEKLDGTGYPRRIGAEELSIPARILAVADVFEALTATDRPYLKPKTLAKALSIMASMSREGHLDPDLFDILLSSGVYAEYANEYLRADQLDEVDIETLRS